MNYVLIPLFNESPNVELLAANLLQAPFESKYFVFVDDHSTDDTVSKLTQCFSGVDHTVIEKDENYGPGHSFDLGFNWILQHSQSLSDRVITMEGDNTSDVSLLPNMLSISALGYDLVLASPYAQGGGFDHTNWYRKLLSFIANMIFRLFFNVKVLTLSSFYRVYHVGLLRKIKMQNDAIIAEHGFLCMFEILLKAIKAEEKIIEVPMTLYTLNRKGKSKMKVVETMLSYAALLFRSNVSRKP